jgi:hypothetical protein
MVSTNIHGVVRQGDLLSPTLFILSQEILFCGLNHLLDQSNFVPYALPNHCPPVSHLNLASNTIIFCTRGRRNLLKTVLSSMPMLLLHFVRPPLSGFYDLDQLLSSFSRVCSPTLVFERDIGSLGTLFASLLKKMALA